MATEKANCSETVEPTSEKKKAELEAFKKLFRGYRYSNADSASEQHNTSKAESSSQLQNKPDRRRPPPPSEDNETAAPPSKKQRTSLTGYAPPSRYSHLPYLNDVVAPDLLVLFIGLNPGLTTAKQGHAYAHPSNLFWKLLHSSGLTDRKCAPKEDVDMPELYSLGFTNIVGRPSRQQSELSRAEMVAGTPVLEEKARQWKPEACCLVGKGIWEAVFQWKYGKKLSKEEFAYGWQNEKHNLGKSKDWKGARVFVAASTSAASASLQLHEKEAIWKPLGQWAKQRRIERSETSEISATG